MEDSSGLLHTVLAVLDTRAKMIAAIIVLIVVFTRLASGVLGVSRSTPKGRTVPLVPYWVPIIGHFPQFFFDKHPFLAWARQKHPEGTFALNLFGSTHYVVFKPSFGSILLNAKGDVAETEGTFRYIMQAVFAWPKSEDDKYDPSIKELHDLYKVIQSKPGLPDMIAVAVTELKRNINSLVTFCDSPVDQPTWERVSGAHPVTLPDGEQGMEVNLYKLIREWSAVTSNLAIFGSDMQNNNPGLFEDLWALDKGFIPLASGLPGWLPIPQISRPHRARARLISAITEWEQAMVKYTAGQDPGSKWSNLDDVSDVIKARIPVYERHKLSWTARSSVELSLIWAANANAHPLVFWIVARLFGDAEMLAAVRAEVRPHMTISLPSGEFGPLEPARLAAVDHDALAERCPLLKACYIESLRMDVGGWSYKVMKQDLVLRSRDKTSEEEGYVIPKDSVCHVAHELHHMDPEAWPQPESWQPRRHLRPDPQDPKREVAEMGNIRPYGGGAHMCKGRQFALREIVLFVAAIITFYDMQPLPGQEWKLPLPKDTVGTHAIKGEMRAVVKRRKILAE